MKFICKYCKVEVVSRENPEPVLGKEHGKHCPRRFRRFHPNARTKK